MKSGRWLIISISFCFVFTLLNTLSAFAGPSRTTYQAKIVKPDGYPLESSNVNFKFTILEPAGCSLYAETFSNVNMGSSLGLVSFSLGSGVRVYPVSGSTFEQVFSNTTASLACETSGVPSTYSPTATDSRKVVMQFNDGGGWQTLPPMTINAVPYAMYANDSLKFQGKDITDFVQVATLPTCTASQAMRFNGASFSCVAVGGSGAVTSGSVITALGYTPADSSTLSTVTTYASNVSSTVYSVSSTVSTLQASVAASFATIVSSQWVTSGTKVIYNLGGIEVSGGIRVGLESSTCTSALAGTLRYNGGAVEYCNGTGWAAFGVSGAGLTLLNGSASNTQTFANGTSGNSPAFVTANGVHTLNIPFASAGTTTAGLISNTEYSLFSTVVNKITSSAASIVQVLGYTPADNAAVVSLNSTVSSVSSSVSTANSNIAVVSSSLATANSNISAVSSTLTNFSNSTATSFTTYAAANAASFSAITSSQWTASGTGIYYPNNVSVGTSGTLGTLAVGDPATNSQTITLNAANFAWYGWYLGGTRTAFIQSTASEYSIFSQTSGVPINFYTSGASRMVISASGSVGIASASPGSRLVVKGAGTTAATTALTVTNSSNQNYFTVRDDGNVGISSASPGVKLTVNGLVSLGENNTIDSSNSSNKASQFGNNNVYISGGGGSNEAYAFGSYNTIDNGGSGSRSTFIYGSRNVANDSTVVLGYGVSNTATNSVAIGYNATTLNVLNTGKVGIGTTNPTATLTSRGNLQVGASATTAPRGVADFVGGDVHVRDDSGTNFVLLSHAGTMPSAGPELRFYRGGFADTRFYYDNYVGYLMHFSSNFMTDGNFYSGGNVGIGTSSPVNTRLHLNNGSTTLAPLKFTSGTLLASPASGAVEYDGSYYYITDGTNTRRMIATVATPGVINNISTVSSTSGITLWPASGNSVTVSSTVASTNSSTGALIVNGGAGIAGALNVGGIISGSAIIKGTGFRANQGAPDAADSSTVGYAFGQDGDTGIFSPGSGSANGVLSFYSNNAERMRLTTSGSLGIGAYPMAPLHVSNSSTFFKAIFGRDDNSTSESSMLKLDAAGSSANTAGIALTSGGNQISGSVIWRPSTSGGLFMKGSVNFASMTGVTPDVYIDNTGNVAIGSGTATHKFTMSKNFTGVSSQTAAFIGGTDAGTGPTGLYIAQKDNLGLSTNTTLLMNVVQNDNSKMVVTGAGNVGIGTTSPNQKLDVQSNDSDTRVNVQNNSSTAARYPGYLAQNYNGGQGGAPNFAGIAYRGNINSPAPVQQFDSLMLLSGAGAYNTSYGNTSQAMINFTAAETFSATARGTDMTFATTPTGSTTMQTRMIISQNGNVGIGTTTPNFNLHVHTNSDSGFRVSRNGYSGSIKSGISDSGGEAFNSVVTDDSFMYNDGGAFTLGTTAAHAVKIGTNATERMRIDSAGNVGIGTSNLQAKFTVYGTRQSTITPTNAITQVGGNDVFLYTGAGNGIGNSYPIMMQAMRDSDSAPFGMSLNPNGGNVGVGVMDPLSRLHVSGTSLAGMLLENGTSDSPNLIFRDSTTASTWNMDSSAGVLRFFTETSLSGGGGVERVTFLPSGRVGIGTNSPATNLHIRGGASYGAIMLGDNGGINNHHITHELDGSFGIWNGTFGAGTRQLAIASAGAVTVISQIRSEVAAADTNLARIPQANEIVLETAGNGTTSSWLWREKWPASNYGIFHDNTTDYLHVVGANSPRLSVGLSNSYVGVNTSAPTANLHVTGTTRIVDGNQAAGRVLASDASGNAAWKQAIIHGTINSTGNTSNGAQAGSGVSITLPPGRWQITGMGITTPTSCRADFGIRNTANNAIVKYTLMPANDPGSPDYQTATVTGYVDIASTTTYDLYITSRGACASQIHVDNNLWELTATGVAY